MKCHSKIKQIVSRSLMCLTTIFSILLFIPFEVKAQLRPWDHTNQVFIDLSVINDASDLRQISEYVDFAQVKQGPVVILLDFHLMAQDH